MLRHHPLGDHTRALGVGRHDLGLTEGGLGAAAPFLLVTRVTGPEWGCLPGIASPTVLPSTAIALGLGFAGTWRAQATKKRHCICTPTVRVGIGGSPRW